MSPAIRAIEAVTRKYAKADLGNAATAKAFAAEFEAVLAAHAYTRTMIKHFDNGLAKYRISDKAGNEIMTTYGPALQ